MKLMRTAIIVTVFVPAVIAQNTSDDSTTGAKAVFGDKNRFAPKENPHVTHSASSPVQQSTPIASLKPTGLRYWIELILPGSPEIQRVTSSRPFHSGDRIRLHFESNIDGRIVLMQMTPLGGSEVLFPSARVRNGDNHIKARTDTILPAENGWFTFDEHPGTERIMVLLTPEPDIASGPSHVADSNNSQAGPPHSGEHGTSTVQGTEQAPEHGVIGKALSSSAGKKFAADETKAILGHITKALGSKSLIVETDDTSAQPAAYAVNVSNNRQANAPHVLAIEIQLRHL